MPLTAQTVGNDVMLVVNALVPVIEAADPAIGVAISIGQKIIQGAIVLEPSAVALYNQIKAGTPPSQQQMNDYAAEYEASYQKLNADINAKLATL